MQRISRDQILEQETTGRNLTQGASRQTDAAQCRQEFRALAENAHDVIGRFDRDCRFVYANPALEKLLGVPKQTLISKKFPDVLPESSGAVSFQGKVREVLETDSPIEAEITLETLRTGYPVCHQVRFVPERDRSGQVASVLTIGREITTVREAEGKLRTMAENFPDFIARFDAECRFLYVNPWITKTYGLLLEHFVGKTLHDPTLPGLLSPGQSERLQDGIKRAFQQGVPNTLEAKWTTPRGERIFEVRHIPERNESGKVVSVLGIARDITERKQHEEILRERAELQSRLSKITNVVPVAIFEFRLAPDGKISMPYSTPAIKDVYGFNPEELTDDVSPAWALIHPQDVPFVRGAMMESARTLEPFHREWRVRHPTRGEIWVDCRSITEREPDGGTVWYGYFHDITERKEAEAEVDKLTAELEQRVSERTAQLETANEELESFSYSVSHDLRAPVRAIDGFSRILLEDYADKLDAEGKASLLTIIATSQRMSELINDLLQLSRFTRAELRRVPVDLSALARNVAEELKSTRPGRDVEFVIEPGLVTQADEHLLRIVLENLLGNALKFTSRRPAARIEFGRTLHEGAPAYFVRDNGAGFDMAHAHRLFGAFQRLHNAAEFPGTGIGLATVQRVIRRHGGQVWAEGERGRGATFYFTLPDKRKPH
jgi:PAS domain S-box-containing protein